MPQDAIFNQTMLMSRVPGKEHALILFIQTLALYKSFTYLFTYYCSLDCYH